MKQLGLYLAVLLSLWSFLGADEAHGKDIYWDKFVVIQLLSSKDYLISVRNF